MVPLRQQILVYPSVQPRPEFDHLLAELSGEVKSRFRGRGHDFYRIRPYVAFESARHVDWKASAHTGDLQVREFTKRKKNRPSSYSWISNAHHLERSSRPSLIVVPALSGISPSTAGR